MKKQLTNRQKKICAQLGITPEQFIAVGEVPGKGGALTERQRKICAQLGITPEQFAAVRR